MKKIIYCIINFFICFKFNNVIKIINLYQFIYKNINNNNENNENKK